MFGIKIGAIRFGSPVMGKTRLALTKFPASFFETYNCTNHVYRVQREYCVYIRIIISEILKTVQDTLKFGGRTWMDNSGD